MALVFQYGSNISSDRLNSPDRLQGDAVPVGIARTMDDFELDFTVWSRSNSCAAADILPGAGRKVWGVLYEIPDYLIKRDTAGGRRSLDAIEGEGTNYRRVHIALEDARGTPIENDVITYVAITRRAGLRTSLEYCHHIISGLQQHDVPSHYIDYVKERIVANNPGLRDEVKQL
ncbi:MAG: gamma-glutamylcyclotransferase [Chloroflexi bacterium]|nr:gamma-glutamylcyclotransferase [Chloroflexota bacterium]